MAENKHIIVVDASVIVKWASIEPDDLEQALMLKDDFMARRSVIIVPIFCFTEVCNTLFLKRQDIAMSFFSDLIEIEIIEYQLSINLVNIASELMRQYPGVTFYDAAYHALAIKENGTFVTADEKYYNKTRKEGSIMLLKDYGKKR